MEQELNTKDINQNFDQTKEIKLKKSWLPKLFFYLVLFVIVFFWIANSLNNTKPDSWINNLPFIEQAKKLVGGTSANTTIKENISDRINILLLGIGGAGHDGGYLTDTIILASLQPSTKKVALLSVPRDLTVPIEGVGWKKINNVNAIAESQLKGSGGKTTSETLSKIFKTEINYYVTVDFEAFKKIIDAMDGIDVNVEKSFDDYYYPIMGKEEDPDYASRYEHLHFDSGWQTMDGSTALKYSRSRHGTNGEGSDFSRSRRQQQVLAAVKDKILSRNLFRPSVLSSVANSMQDHVSTNLSVSDGVKIWSTFGSADSNQIIRRSLDNGPDGLLADQIALDGAYILVAKSGDFSEIRSLISNIFIDPNAQAKAVESENASIEIRNGTWVDGMAARVALQLEKQGFKIHQIGNMTTRDYKKTVVYDLTYGAKIEALKTLKNNFNTSIYLGGTDWLTSEINKESRGMIATSSPDFVLVLGEDAY